MSNDSFVNRSADGLARLDAALAWALATCRHANEASHAPLSFR